MTKAKREQTITFRPDPDTLDAIQALQERDGIGTSETIRRGLRMFLESKGVLKPSATRKPAKRK